MRVGVSAVVVGWLFGRSVDDERAAPGSIVGLAGGEVVVAVAGGGAVEGSRDTGELH